jgi:sigma-B regulation protein RsbU (phosphoserine phosphatase)
MEQGFDCHRKRVFRRGGRAQIGVWLLVCLCLVSLSAIPVSADEQAAGGSAPQKILVLHSYHEGHVWTQSLNEGIESYFDNSGMDVDLFIEYMDTARISEPGYSRKMYELYRVKYADIRFDAVIVADDGAYQFMQLRHKDLFPMSPCIFCGVSGYQEGDLDEWSGCTGVVEAYDLKSTLDMALQLHPGTSRLVVINDRSITGISNKQRLMEVIPAYEDRLSVTYLEDLEMDDLRETVRTLPDDAVILMMTYNIDGAGTYYEHEESIALVSSASSVPIYGVWDFYLGEGIVGGKLAYGADQGRIAAELTGRILDGEEASSIPVVTEVPTYWMFDNHQLLRFGIPTSALPAESRIINRLPGIIPVNVHVFWGVIAGIAVLVGAVMILVANTIRRRRAEEALRRSEEEFRHLSVLQHEALEQIEENMEQMAILNDHIRNPLQAIVGLADLEGGPMAEKIFQQAGEIDSLINRLDQGWLESDKIRDFLRRHHPREKKNTSKGSDA